MSTILVSAVRRRRIPMALGFCALLGVVVLVFAWGHSAPTRASAEGEGDAVDFSLRIDDCIGGPVTTKGGDAACDIAVGQTFTAALDLNSAAVVPEPGYDGFDISVPDGGLAWTGGGGCTWPDCVLCGFTYAYGPVLGGCGIGDGAPSSTYLGELYLLDYRCTVEPSSGHTITLVHGAATGNTNLYAGGEGHAEKGTETITVNCVPPSTPPSVGGVGFFTDVADSSGASAGVVTALIAASTAGAVALGGAAWYARRWWLG